MHVNELLLSSSVKDSDSAEDSINVDLVKIRSWCFDNYLLLNPDKTKRTIFGSRQMISKLLGFKICMLGNEMRPSQSVKDLGVIFHASLSFDNHISASTASCFSKLAQICHAKHAFNPGHLAITINALVFSISSVCSSTSSPGKHT